MRVFKSRPIFNSLSFLLILKILCGFTILQNVKCVNSKVSLLDETRMGSLVILFAVNVHFAWGASIRNGKQREIEASTESLSIEDAVERIRGKVRHRVSRQLGIVAPALQTMGCLPKFFCGMSSKKPSGSTSTLNDLAYLIKFAMVDDVDDSFENKGKDDVNSDETDERTSDEIRLDNQRYEHWAEEQMIQEDPEYLNFVWKDMKKKIRNKFKDGKMDEQILNQMMEDMDKESRFKVPSLFSGLKSLVRLGRSVDNSTRLYHRKSKGFWETNEFDEQMKLAARIGQASSSNSDKQCTTTFNLCPYTINQMKGMVIGKDTDYKDSSSIKQPVWYDNLNPPQSEDNSENKPQFALTTPSPTPPRQKTTPNPLSNIIYVLNPDSVDGRKPPPPQQFPVPTTTQAPETSSFQSFPKKVQKRPIMANKPHKPFSIMKETEDDETGFDNPSINYYEKDALPHKPVTTVIKLNASKEEESDERYVSNTSSEEEASDKPLKIPPKTKTKPKNDAESDEDVVNESSEEKEPSKPASLKPVKPVLPKFKKTKIGIPRPKYTIKHKYRNRPLHIDQSLDKKKEAIAQSEEENKSINIDSESDETPKNSEESNTNAASNKKRVVKEKNKSSEENETTEEKSNKRNKYKGNKPFKYTLKNRPKNKLEFKKIENSDENVEYEDDDEDDKKKKAEMENSSEEKTSSEEQAAAEISPSSSENNSKASDESYQEEDNQHPKPSSHPIKYSYFKQNSEQSSSETVQNVVPRPKPTSGGIISHLFGGKKHHQNRPNPHQGHPSNKNPDHQAQEIPSNNDTSKEEKNSSEEKTSKSGIRKDEGHDSSEEKQSVGNLPPVFGSANANSDDEDEKRPVISNPVESKPTAKYPPLPRFPPPSRPPTTVAQGSTSTAPPSKPKSKYKDESDSEENDKSEDSASKEDDKSPETQESEESDPLHVKNIFSKSSISSLGEGAEEHQPEIPPPPPPIANWKPINATGHKSSTNKNNAKNNEKHSEEKPHVVTPTMSIPAKIQKFTKLLSAEVKTDQDSTDEEHGEDSTEGDKDEEEAKKKTEDDEADNKEPIIVPAEDDIPELGDVVSINPKPLTLNKSPGYPAVAPVSNFDKTNEIQVPSSPPASSSSELLTNRKPSIDPRDPTKANTNAGPSPGSLPGGPGSLSNPAGQAAQGNRAPGGGQGNRAPGGGNRRPGGGNRRPGNGQGNQRPGEENMGGNMSPATPETEDSSEEEVGKDSSEEEAEKSSEEEDGRSGLKSKKKKSVIKNKTDQDKVNTTTALDSAGPSDATTFGNRVYPPLPPIYQWKSEPTQLTKLKSTTLTPKLRLPRPKPTKDTFYTKPLSPQLVQYLRETYGNSFVLPDRKKKTTSTTPKPKESIPTKTKKGWTKSNLIKTFELSNLGGKASDVIHFDEFEHSDDDLTNYGKFSKRMGQVAKNTTTRKKKPKNKPRPFLPPIFGHFQG